MTSKKHALNDPVNDAPALAAAVDGAITESSNTVFDALNAVEQAGSVRPVERDASRMLASAAEAALADLEQRVSLEMGPLERVLAARVRAAVAQLLECALQLAGEELMICGSTGQQRSHPLLKTLAELRREISDGLKELTFRADQRAMFERTKALQQLGHTPPRRKEKP